MLSNEIDWKISNLNHHLANCNGFKESVFCWTNKYFHFEINKDDTMKWQTDIWMKTNLRQTNSEVPKSIILLFGIFHTKKNVSISIIKKPRKCHKIIKPFSDALTLTFFDENVNESLENGDLWIRRLKKTFWKCRFASDPVWFISNVYNLFSCINHESAKHYNNFGMRKTEMRRKKTKTLENQFMFFGQHFACTSKLRRIDAELGFCSSETTLLSLYLTYKYIHISEIECAITHEFDRLLRRWTYLCLFRWVGRKLKFFRVWWNFKWQFRRAKYSLSYGNERIKWKQSQSKLQTSSEIAPCGCALSIITNSPKRKLCTIQRICALIVQKLQFSQNFDQRHADSICINESNFYP